MFSDKSNLLFDKRIKIETNCYFYTNIKETRFGSIDEDTLEFRDYCKFKDIACYLTGLSIDNMFGFSTQVSARYSYITSEKIPQDVLSKFNTIQSVEYIPDLDLTEFEYFLYYLLSQKGSTEYHPYSLYVPISLIKMSKNKVWNGFQKDYNPEVNIKKIFNKLSNGEDLLKLSKKEINIEYFDSLNQYSKIAYYLYLGENRKLKKKLLKKFNDRFYGSFVHDYTNNELSEVRKALVNES